MHYNKEEVTIIYNGKKSIDKKVIALVQGIKAKVNKQDITEVRLSSTLFRLALEKLGVEAKNVMDKSSNLYQEAIKGRDPEVDEAYFLIMKNPDLLKCPIVLYKDKTILCQTPTDVLKVA